MKKVFYLLLPLLIISFLFANTTEAQKSVRLNGPYDDTYAALEAEIELYDELIMQYWDQKPAEVNFSGELLSANANLGPVLLDIEHRERVLLELTRLKDLGIDAVAVSVHFPLLYPPYHENQTDFLGYANFYTWVAQVSRALGLKVIVETQLAFPSPELGGDALTDYYEGLSWPEWVQARAVTSKNIALLMQPDYLTIISEPDTEADMSSKWQLETYQGIIDLVSSVATFVKSEFPEQKLGAGMGSWHRIAFDLADGICADPNIDYMNLHIYPINASDDLLMNAVDIGNICKAHGKPTAVGETWLYKINTDEFGLGLSPFQIFARDPFDFWAPLDQKFLNMMVKLAHFQEWEFMSIYWSRYSFAYLTYGPEHWFLLPEEIEALADQAALDAMWAGEYSSTGVAYSIYINAEWSAE